MEVVLSDQKLFKIPPHVVSHKVENEVVVLNVDTSCYFTLNGTASVFWEQLAKTGDMSLSVAEVARLYPETGNDVDLHFQELIGELLEEGLILQS